MIKKTIKNLYTNDTQVILASSSQTRQDILKGYDIDFEVRPHRVDEDILKKKLIHLDPEQLVIKIAKAKAESQAYNKNNEIIIGSDQLLYCKGKLISKAKNLDEAKEKLMFLNNSKHKLLNAVYIIWKEETIWIKETKAKLFMRKMTEIDIETYLEKNKKNILKTVGGYKIEEDRMKLLTVIEGKLEDIQGFPISSFISYLKGCK